MLGLLPAISFFPPPHEQHDLFDIKSLSSYSPQRFVLRFPPGVYPRQPRKSVPVAPLSLSTQISAPPWIGVNSRIMLFVDL